MSSAEGKVADKLCAEPKPPSTYKACNMHSCSYKWQIDRWSKCNACNQMRNVWCGRESRHWEEAKPIRVDDKKCSDNVKPAITRMCGCKCGGRKIRKADGENLKQKIKNKN
jgi:hypothetical protein